MSYDKNTKIMVASAGAELSAVDQDGVVSWSIGLKGGIYSAADYLPLLQEGETLSGSGSITFRQPKNRLVRDNLGDLAYESGANPDFVVTSASRFQREMEIKMAKMDQTEKRLERKLASLDALADRHAAAPQPDAPDVLDDEDEGEPLPDPVIEPDGPEIGVAKK